MSNTDTATRFGSGDHEEALAALERIESEFGQSRLESAVDPGQICQQYQQIKPLLNTALTLVQAIPIYGPRIAGAIRLLMGIADTLCNQRS